MNTPGSSESQVPQEAPAGAAVPAGSPIAHSIGNSHGGNAEPAVSLAARMGSASPQWLPLPQLDDSFLRSRPRRRLILPLVLSIATCLSTFWVGAASWRPQMVEGTASMQKVI